MELDIKEINVNHSLSEEVTMSRKKYKKKN